MATDDHGMGIPVPDEHTQDYEFYALVRDAVDKIAGHLAAMAARPAPPAPAPVVVPAEIPAEFLGRLEAVEAGIRALAAVPVPEPLQRAIDDARLATAEARHALKTITERND